MFLIFSKKSLKINDLARLNYHFAVSKLIQIFPKKPCPERYKTTILNEMFFIKKNKNL